MESVWSKLSTLGEMNILSFLNGIEIICHISLISNHFHQLSISNILWWNICKISKKIEQDTYNKCIEYPNWKQFYISNPCIGRDCSSIAKGINRVHNNQTLFFSPGIYECSDSDTEFVMNSKQIFNIIGIGDKNSDVVIIKSKYNSNSVRVSPTIISICHSNKTMKCMINNVKLRLCFG